MHFGCAIGLIYSLITSNNWALSPYHNSRIVCVWILAIERQLIIQQQLSNHGPSKASVDSFLGTAAAKAHGDFKGVVGIVALVWHQKESHEKS